jgi:subtilase family serine protease
MKGLEYMRRPIPAIVATLALTGATVLAGSPAAFANDRSPVAGSQPGWATTQNRAGDAEAAKKLSFRVYLKMRDRAGAEATARAVSDPSSATFRKYLSTDQVRQRYAPQASSVSAVRSWLQSGGFQLGQVPANNLYVEATGTVAAVERAFGVDLGMYRVQGSTLRAPAHDLSVPTSIASVVSGIVGVDQAQNLLRPQHTTGDSAATGTVHNSVATPAAAPNTAPPGPGFRVAPPCSAYWGQKTDTTDPAYGGGFPATLPYAPCGYKPGQLRSAYGLDQLNKAGLDGHGVTVAIVDAFASPTIFQDASTYAQRNDPAHPLKQSQFKQIVLPENPANEELCDASGWYGEETLDVEAVHGMAPGANILYVGGADCQDTSLDTALNDVIANNRAQIVSNSYGDSGEDIPADLVDAFEQIAVQGALEGIGIYFSSGDFGDNTFGDPAASPSPDFSASSPWVTAVGGTSLAIGANGQRLFETGWETGRSKLINGAWTPAAPGGYTSGSGGGTSHLFTEPFYQRGVVPDALAAQGQTGSNRGRVVPDISMVGDPNTGFLVGQTQTFPDGVYYDEYRIGGTSLSSPLMAGLMAVSDEATHVRHGFINPWLYQVTSRTPAITDVQHVNAADVRVDYVNTVDASDGLVTSVRTFDWPGLTIHTTKGYDNVTGLGVPNSPLFLLLS